MVEDFINFFLDPHSQQVEQAMAPHSSTLAWKILWTEEPGGLQSMGLLWVGHNWATSLSLFTSMHWRRKWQPTPVFMPGESQGWWEPGGLPSMGSHRVGHDWSNLAAAQSTAPGAHNFKIFFFTWIQISFCRDQWVCICDCVWLPCLLSNKGDKLWVQK